MNAPPRIEQPQPVRALQPRVLIPFAIVTLIWGSTWLVIRDQLGPVPPSWSVSYRFLVAGIAMCAFALVRRESLRLSASGIAFAAALALAQFVFNFNFVYRAEQHIASGLVAVVFALLVVPNALFGRLFLGQKVSRRFLLGSALAIAGVALLFVHEARRDGAAVTATLLGVGLTLCGVLSASAANILQATEQAKRHAMVPVLGWAMLMGAAVDMAFAWTTTGPPVIELRTGYLLGVLYLGIAASAITFPLYFGVVRAIGPAKAAYSSVLIPVIAMLLSTLFEGYRWSLLAAAGSMLALIGLIVALSARNPAR